ncbi:MAG TPA: PAS domain S-box protein [Smithella sp.]|nr:PAS domain S-box protein [Smithella sp.]MDM7985821.1 PAS domain S-box protein [Smithella sp.]HNY50803.1 PAS domain S-box protein [Smithella sp.]HOG91010.1 PAS domain S-box protein [Smithella sp.]HOU51165.1 PAS domain S-box protein [Smithella sp.]
MATQDRTKAELIEELEKSRKKIKNLRSKIRKYQKIEEDLTHSEHFYQTLFENSGTATIVIEQDTTISMMNSDFANFTGYSREEILNHSWTSYVADDDVDRLLYYHRIRRTDPSAAPRNYEFKIKNKDGNLIHVFMTIAMIPGTTQSIASMMDITARAKMEKALRDSEEKFRQLVESMNEGLGIQDRLGIITYVNDKVCKILQLPREKIVGRPSLDFISKRDLETWISNIQNKDAPESYELTWMDKQGNPIYTLVSPRAVYDSQGHFMGGFGVITDITAIKKLEKEVLDTSERERQKIGYELHDDLGQHLIGIDVMTKVLRDKLIPLSEENARYAGEINKLVKDAIEKTRRLARGLCPVYLASLGLETSLTELVDSTASIFNIECSFRCPRHIPIEDNSLATHLYYIAKESIHNAIEHGKSSKIVLELLNNNGIVSLSILDNGVGIKDMTKAGGIGLRIMHYRARMMGASLRIESEQNGGTLVTCTFNLMKD